MKRAILLGTLAMILSIGVLAFAQGPGMWGGGYGGGPGWGGGYGMGPGMMGPGYGGGYGGGPGMMGPGWGVNQGYGPGMGGSYGYGMGQGMMGPGWGGGYGMGPGMMGPGWGARQGYGLSEECHKYFDESAGMRKELHVKQFEYSEAMRNPKTKPEHIVNLEKEIWDLQKQIFSKAPAACR